MKALIWILCTLFAAIVQVVFRYCGIILGAIPMGLLVGGAIWIAQTLCKKLDYHRAIKEAEKQGISVEEYAKQGLTEDFLEGLQKLPYKKIKSVLKAEVRQKHITEAQRTMLLKKYSQTNGKDKSPLK